MKYVKTLLIALSLSTCLSGCATYTLTPQSMLEQFAGTHTENKKLYFKAAPDLFFWGVVNGNSLKEIKVIGKNGNEKILQVTHRTGVRITTKNAKHQTFYFNTLLIKDSTINGKKDHFMGISTKPINLNAISKIEIQE